MIAIKDKRYGGKTQWVAQIERHCNERFCEEPIIVTLHTVNEQRGIKLKLSLNEAALIADNLNRIVLTITEGDGDE